MCFILKVCVGVFYYLAVNFLIFCSTTNVIFSADLKRKRRLNMNF